MALKQVSSGKLLKALNKLGYYIRSQKGSHIHLRHPNKTTLTIPNHKIIAKGTLLAIIKQANITKEELEELLT